MKKTLKDLPQHMQTVQWIESEIRHETFKGIYTVHDCECGRGRCRTNMCAQCWQDILNEKQRKTS